MKKSTKLISLLLAVMMIAALLPTAALADDVDTQSIDDTIGGVIDTVGGIQIPTYIVYCSLMSKMPASGAVITLTNNVTGEASTYTANMLGLAFIPKSLIGVYSVAATCDGPISGLKYSTLPGIKWSFSIKLDADKLILYPVMNIGLNYTDHFAYMIGFPNGNVGPDAKITRAQIATILYRLMTTETREKFAASTSTFNDVSANAWYNTEVCTLHKAGIINGYPDGGFHPEANVTRAEFSAMIARMFSVSYVGNNMFEDINGHWAESFMNILAKLGILKGNDGNANPNDPLTRAQAAAMCNRLVGRNSTNSSMNSCTGTVKGWPDNANSAWYYADILEATNSHNYTWTVNVKNGLSSEFLITEQWTNIRADAPDWSK